VKGGERRRLCERGWCVGRDSPNRFYCQDYEQRKCVWAGQVRCSRPTYVDASCSPTTPQRKSTFYNRPHLIILRGSLFVGQEEPALNIIMSNLYGRSKSTYAASKPSAAASPARNYERQSKGSGSGSAASPSHTTPEHETHTAARHGQPATPTNFSEHITGWLIVSQFGLPVRRAVLCCLRNDATTSSNNCRVESYETSVHRRRVDCSGAM
jgi:hypothetical protein